MASASQDELRELETRLNDRYEQLRKLVNQQAIAFDAKIRALDGELSTFVNKKPDPMMIREFWIRQIPKMREELKFIQMDVAKMKSKEE